MSPAAIIALATAFVFSPRDRILGAPHHGKTPLFGRDDPLIFLGINGAEVERLLAGGRRRRHASPDAMFGAWVDLAALFCMSSLKRCLRLKHRGKDHTGGVLGESFLAHFDLLVDYGHKLLCLDETSTMRDGLRGERIPFVAPQHPENELPYMERLVISVHLSGIGTRAILLQLDSGSDGPILYADSKDPEVQVLERSAAQQGGNNTSAQRAFAVMPPQNMQIGDRIFAHISFVTPVSVQESLPGRNEDGLLPTLFFQRVLISSGGRYVVFDPK